MAEDSSLTIKNLQNSIWRQISEIDRGSGTEVVRDQGKSDLTENGVKKNM